MKAIRAKRTEFIEVEIDEREEKRITKNYLLQTYDIPFDHYYEIKDGELIGYRYDRWDDKIEKFIRFATEMDKTLIEILNRCER